MGAFRDALLGAKNGDSKAVELLYKQFLPLLLKCSMVNLQYAGKPHGIRSQCFRLSSITGG